MVLTEEDLFLANQMISDLELDMPKVFSRIGRTEESVQADRFIEFVYKHGPVTYGAAYSFIHSAFPFVRDFEDIVKGAIAAERIRMDPQTHLLCKVEKKAG